MGRQVLLHGLAGLATICVRVRDAVVAGYDTTLVDVFFFVLPLVRFWEARRTPGSQNAIEWGLS